MLFAYMVPLADRTGGDEKRRANIVFVSDFKVFRVQCLVRAAVGEDGGEQIVGIGPFAPLDRKMDGDDAKADTLPVEQLESVGERGQKQRSMGGSLSATSQSFT